MKLFKLPAKREDRTAILIRLIIMIGLIIFIVLGIFTFSEEASTAQASDKISEMAQSFSQYFNPKVLRAIDAIMKDRSCTPDGYWKIWTYGFHKSFRGADGKKFKIVLNWDGFWYREIGSDVIKEGDWTNLK